MIRRPKRYRKTDEPVKFSKKIIILMFVSMAIFTVTMTVIYIITGGVPDTLVTEFFNFFRLCRLFFLNLDSHFFRRFFDCIYRNI